MEQPKNLLQLKDASKSFGSKQLFRSASFSVNENEYVGVIGPNGAGKTTLFRILTGEVELDSGEVIKSSELKLGYLQQHDIWDDTESAHSYLSKNTAMPIWDLKKLGRDLGISEEQFQMPIKSLSGGYRMRIKLLHLLGEEPNLMLLDEPTNYLDLETVLALETFLQDFKGAFLLISHDREFLRRTTDHILEIESSDFTKYNGNIDDYFEQKQLLREQLEKQALGIAARKQRILEFAARFGAKASKARQVQSRLRSLDKIQDIQLKSLPVAARIHIPKPTHTGRISAVTNDAFLGYGEKVVLRNLNLKIETGDHIGVVGYNGAGKSTFLKGLAKELPVLAGEIKWGYEVSASYFAQHVAETLIPTETVWEALARKAHPSVLTQEIRDVAGSFLFSGDEVHKQVKVLSGGERSRVALAQLLLMKAPLLLLDEPTNHLDFYTVEALTQALRDYVGTVVAVSHDRGFIRRISTKIVEIRGGTARLYPGNYNDYVWHVQQRKIEPEIALVSIPLPLKPEEPKQIIKPKANANRDQIKRFDQERRSCERQLNEIDKKMKILEEIVAEKTELLAKTKGEKLISISNELAATQRKIEELETAFMRLMEQKEAALEHINALKGNPQES